jgi:ribosomal protein S18 acetylase RimI-like enzyme
VGVALVAEDRGGVVVGALMACPPTRWLEHLIAQGIPHRVVERQLLRRLAKLTGGAVAEQVRGLGVGSALVRDCERRFRERGYDQLYGQFAVSQDLLAGFTRSGGTPSWIRASVWA